MEVPASLLIYNKQQRTRAQRSVSALVKTGRNICWPRRYPVHDRMVLFCRPPSYKTRHNQYDAFTQQGSLPVHDVAVTLRFAVAGDRQTPDLCFTAFRYGRAHHRPRSEAQQIIAALKI